LIQKKSLDIVLRILMIWSDLLLNFSGCLHIL
jgi:hypothetical protein